MPIDLGLHPLRNGEKVSAAVIAGPDPLWADRVETMLGHKGDPWNWQNAALLRQPTGLDARFFILHRDGIPFSNIMVVAHAGVGLLGHVWTSETDRGQGASSILMELALADFRQRRGRALFLGTEFDSPPWHYYHRRGFVPIAEGSGYMVLHTDHATSFEQTWFTPAAAVIEPFAWPHWPAAAPLFLRESGGSIRLAATRLFGRSLCEGPLLPLLQRHPRDRANAFVLRSTATDAVLGLASVHPDPLWPDTSVLDVFCHDASWPEADALIAHLDLPPARRVIAYVDSQQPAKRAALERAGFRALAELPAWIAAPLPAKTRLDVTLLARP